VAYRDTSTAARLKVDVVDAHRHLGDDPQPRRPVEKLRVDSVGQHGQESIRCHHSCEEISAGHRLVQLPHRHLMSCSNPGELPFWYVAAD
jgi:hypothetical protein